MAALRARGTNLKKLAERGVETFFTQVFEHNFFHADMHPGNIFIDVTDPDDPRYIAIDCAIVGSLTGKIRITSLATSSHSSTVTTPRSPDSISSPAGYPSILTQRSSSG